MNTRLLHKMLFSIADTLRGDNSIDKLCLLRKSQYWSKGVLRTWQLERINALLEHAKKNSPFYEKRLKHVVLPLKSLEFLQDIPILTKKDIRQNIDGIKCLNINKNRFILSNTGGSTGEPMQYFSDRVSRGWERAAIIRNSEWAGLSLGEKNIQMTGSHYEYTKRKKAINRLKLWLLNGKGMSVVFMNNEILEKYYKQVLLWQPTSIWGYASALYYFAEFIKKHYPKTDLGFVKAIITSSETLQRHQREVINGIFGQGKVFDHYGSSEFYAAAECRFHNGYHINSDILHLEIVDKDGQHEKTSEIGKIILTDFYNFAFPFIRYEIGDIGVLSEQQTCKCGINLPLLKKLEGRIADTVVLSDRILTAPNFTNIFRPLKGVEEYQIIQKTIADMQINVVKNGRFTQENEAHIYNSLKNILGTSSSFKLNYVDSIEIPKSGKRRYVISEVAKEVL